MLNKLIEPEQVAAARVVGLAYLLTMGTAVFAEMYVRGQLVVSGNAAQTALNILDSERLFRVAIVGDILTAVGVTILIWALYVVLRPVNNNLAMLGVFLRLVEVPIAAVSVINALLALRVLSGTAYLQTFDESQLQELARLFISGQGFGTQILFVFLGLGSTVFSCLWFKSNYIPKALALLGIVGSLMLVSGSLAVIVFPKLGDLLSLSYMMLLGIFEITLGLWLLIKGLRSPMLTPHTDQD